MSETFGDNIICPHCGHIHRDSWEIMMEDGVEEIECDKCGQAFVATRHTSVNYWAEKIITMPIPERSQE